MGVQLSPLTVTNIAHTQNTDSITPSNNIPSSLHLSYFQHDPTCLIETQASTVTVLQKHHKL